MRKALSLIVKCTCPFKVSLEELALLKAVGENPHITQEALKRTIGKSISTIKRLTVSLQKKGILVRRNGKRDGYWEVLT